MAKRRKSQKSKKNGGCAVLIGIGIVFLVLAALLGKDDTPKQRTVSQQSPVKKTQRPKMTPSPTPTPTPAYIEVLKGIPEEKQRQIWKDFSFMQHQGLNEQDESGLRKHYQITGEQYEAIQQAGMAEEWKQPIIPTPRPTPQPTATPRPTAIPTRKPVQHSTGQSSSGFSCSPRKLCSEMKSCAEARFHLKECHNSKLDRDRDGIPCESLCQ